MVGATGTVYAFEPMAQTLTPPSETAARPVQQAIFARRSVRKFTPEPVDREILSRLLDAGTQAPNHKLTRPWRFFVVDRPGAVREQLVKLAEAAALRGAPEPYDAVALKRAEAKSRDVAEVPVLILAFAVPGRDEHETRENYAAVSCALQNIQLAAAEEGLACGWSTGAVTRDPAVMAAIGAEADWEPVGGLYIGWPAPGSTPTSTRPGATNVTRWLCD
jgi:nitroreductase